MFPIEDLRQAVDTAKKLPTKEKLDKQLTGQTSTSPFMSIREGTDKRVSFNTRDKLGEKIDRLTVVMSKLVAKDNHEKNPFRPQIYKSRDKIGLMVKGDIEPGQMIETRVVVQTIIQDKIIELIDLEEISEGRTDRIVEKSTEVKGMVTTIEIGIDQEGEPPQGTIGETEALAMLGLDQGPELVQIGIG